MDRQLTEIGTIPVTTSIIESLYPELKSANKKVTWLEKQGFIIRLKRGWKIQCKLPPKTKRFCPLKTFNNAPLKSLDRWGYYYFTKVSHPLKH